MVNYNTVYNKAVYKYLLKAFYNRINRKEYELHIWLYNMWHINIIAMKDIILLKKIGKKRELLKDIADISVSVKVAQAISLIDLVLKYKWIINNADLDLSKELVLTEVNKY